MPKTPKTKGFKLKDTVFIQSFRKININLVYISLFTAGFFVVFYLLSMLLNWLAAKLNLTELLQKASALTEESAFESMALTQELYSKLNSLVIYFVIFIIIAIAVWSIFEGMALNLLYKRKFKKPLIKLIAKFFGVNIVVSIILALILLLISITVKEQVAKYLVLFILLIAVYFITIINLVLFKEQSVKKMLKKLKIGITKFHQILPHYILAIITIFIFLIPFSLIAAFLPVIASIIVLLPFIYAMAWYRHYMKMVVK